MAVEGFPIQISLLPGNSPARGWATESVCTPVALRKELRRGAGFAQGSHPLGRPSASPEPTLGPLVLRTRVGRISDVSALCVFISVPLTVQAPRSRLACPSHAHEGAS